MFDRCVNWIEILLRQKFSTLGVFFLLTVLIAAGASNITFSTNYRAFFNASDVKVSAYDIMQTVYSKNDNVLIAIESKSGQVFNSDNLLAIRALTDKAWQLPYATRVDSLANYQHSHATGDDIFVADLIESTDSLSDAQVRQIKEVALREPLLKNKLITDKENITGINIVFHLPEDNLNAVFPTIVEAVRALAAEAKATHPDFDVYLSGTVMINNAFLEVAKADIMTLIPVMFLMIILLLVWHFRSLSSTFAIFTVIGMATAVSFGVGGWAGIELTPPSSAAAPIILTLSVAASVHLLNTFYRLYCTESYDKYAAIVGSLRLNIKPITLTSVTTVIGFLSMNFAESPPFHDLGNLVAIGIIAAYVFTVVLLPCLVLLLPFKHNAERKINFRYLTWVDRIARTRSNLVLMVAALVIVLLAGLAQRNELNDDFLKYFNENIQFRVDNDHITEHLTGVYLLEYSIDSKVADGISDPNYLRIVEGFAQWFRKQPEVMHVQAITDIYKKANQNLHDDDPQFYQLPDSSALAAQVLLLYEMSLPNGLTLNDQISVDKSATRFIVAVRTLPAKSLIELEQRAHQWFIGLAPARYEAVATGPAILFAHIGMRSINTGLFGGAAALVLISLCLIPVFRSFKLGLISLLPNLLPVGMAFGIWGLFSGQINMALSTVMGMTLGIVVDDTIHFISHFQKGLKEHGDAGRAVSTSLHEVGTAITITSMVLAAGFLVLTFSDFILNWGMGLLTAITILFAWLIDIVVLPALLVKTMEDSREKNMVADADRV